MFARKFLDEVSDLAHGFNADDVDRLAYSLAALRANHQRLFLFGLGGSAANASHAAADFRRMCGLEVHCATDNVAELSASINDDGWELCFVEWLKRFNPVPGEAIMVFSVGGGNRPANISVPIIRVCDWAAAMCLQVFGIVGRDGGAVKERGDVVLVVPPAFPENVTAHTEAFQGILWHCLAFHPALNLRAGKWESTHAAT